MIVPSPSKRVSRRRRVALIGVLVLAFGAVGAMSVGGVAGAKTKKKKATATVFQASASPNAAIPDDVAGGVSIPVNSTLTAGKKFKGKVVGDVNVTGIRTTGSGAGAANDLAFRLIAPNGRAVLLIGENRSIGDVSIGPLTLDDDTTAMICDATTPPCSYATQTLNRPFAGTANLAFLGAAGTGPLSHLDGLPIKGTWTLQVWDFSSPGQTSVLNGWGLQVTAARPVS
jgi:hypothetical protein